jgi:LCP family protein required for cell wall assembly
MAAAASRVARESDTAVRGPVGHPGADAAPAYVASLGSLHPAASAGMRTARPPGVEDAGVPDHLRADRTHRRTVVRVVLVTQLVLAVLTVAGVTLAYRQLDGGIRSEDVTRLLTDRPEKEDVEGPMDPLNILVMGTDDRSCEGCAIDGEAGGGGSDTTLLLHVSADRQEAYGISLPRDALVTRPDCIGEDGGTIPGGELEMFNSAFALGGPACAIQTVEQLTGVLIDHYVTVDFNGFVDMVDAVGGVEVCIPKDVDDPVRNIFFEAGTQTLEGRQALNYVRERYVLSANSDIGRMKRQQAFIASMVNKVVSAGTLTRPDRVYRFLSAATRSITVDEELGSIQDLVDLALQFRSTGLGDIEFVTVPNETYEPDPNRLVWSDKAAKLWKRVAKDKGLPRKLNRGSISAEDPVGTSSADPTPTDTASPTTDPEEAAEEQEEAAAALANGLCA